MKIEVGWGYSLYSGFQALQLVREGTLLFPGSAPDPPCRTFSHFSPCLKLLLMVVCSLKQQLTQLYFPGFSAFQLVGPVFYLDPQLLLSQSGDQSCVLPVDWCEITKISLIFYIQLLFVTPDNLKPYLDTQKGYFASFSSILVSWYLCYCTSCFASFFVVVLCLFVSGQQNKKCQKSLHREALVEGPWAYTWKACSVIHYYTSRYTTTTCDFGSSSPGHTLGPTPIAIAKLW